MSKENNNKKSYKENESLTEKTGIISIPKEIKSNIILPSLKNNNMTIPANKSEKKIVFDSMKKYDQDLKNSLRAKKKSLNTSTSLQNLREKEFNRIKEKYENKIMNYSNRLLENKNSMIKVNHLKNFVSMREPNRTNKIKKSFFDDKIKHFEKIGINRKNTKDSRNSKEKSINLNLTKNTNTNDETSKEAKSFNNFYNSKSTIYKISKIKLNNYPMSKINETQNKKRQAYNPRVSSIPKHSPFFHQSQSDAVGTQTIYKYYLNKSSSDITLPVKNFNKLFKDKTHSVYEKLKRIYCENKNFEALIRELKDNRKLAFKDDFDIEEYQNMLLELLEKRVSQKHLIDLQDDYRELNKKLFDVFEPKGRFTFLAEKLRYNLPSFLLEKMKQLDKDSIISRMNYYNQFKQFKKDKKLVIKFGRKDETKKKIKKKKEETENEEENKEDDKEK
jgi:hypothetical protein